MCREDREDDDDAVLLRDEPGASSEGVSETRRFFEGEGPSELRPTGLWMGGDALGVISGGRGGGIIDDARDDGLAVFIVVLIVLESAANDGGERSGPRRGHRRSRI